MRNILRREEHPEMNDPQDRLAESMAELLRPMGTLDRIPPAITEEERVLSFRDLPTRELDEIVEAAGKEYEALKAECQQIRNAYIHYTNNVAKQVQRLREGMKLGMETMQQLRLQCNKLDEPILKDIPRETDE